MPDPYSQDGRSIRIYVAPDGVSTPSEDYFHLIAFEGREALSELGGFTAYVSLRNGTTLAKDSGGSVEKPSELLGQRVGLRIETTPGSFRFWHGMLVALERTHADDHQSFYRLSLAPRLWLLTHRQHYRVLQTKTTRELIEAAIDKETTAIDWDAPATLSGGRTRNVRTQYAESDYQYLARQLEEEGAFYYLLHAHSDDAPTRCTVGFADDKIELRDLTGADPATIGEAPSGDQQADYFTLRTDRALGDFPTVQPFVERHSVVPAATIHRDHYMGNSGVYSAKVGTTPTDYAVRSDLHAIEPAGQFGHWPTPPAAASDVAAVASALATNSVQRTVADAEYYEGATTFGGMRPAGVFQLLDDELAGVYQVTALDHRYAALEAAGLLGDFLPPSLRRSGNTFTYRNSFTALPASATFRPHRVTPKPRMHGPQTAVVIKSPAEDPATNASLEVFGYIQVRFDWPTDPSTDPAAVSCFLPVSQAWAGNGWGNLFLPRDGQEVIVTFLDGDPDRPIVTGAVYNTNHETPRPDITGFDPALSFIKTHPLDGDDSSRYNSVEFRDRKDEELLRLRGGLDVQIQAQRNLLLLIGENRYDIVGNNNVSQAGLLDGTGSEEGSEEPSGNGEEGGEGGEEDDERAKSPYYEGALTSEHIKEAFFDSDGKAKWPEFKAAPVWEIGAKLGVEGSNGVLVEFASILGVAAEWKIDPTALWQVPGVNNIFSLVGAMALGSHEAKYGSSTALSATQEFELSLGPTNTEIEGLEIKAAKIVVVAGTILHALGVTAYNIVAVCPLKTDPSKILTIFAAVLHGVYLVIMSVAYIAHRVTIAEEAVKETQHITQLLTALLPKLQTASTSVGRALAVQKIDDVKDQNNALKQQEGKEYYEAKAQKWETVEGNYHLIGNESAFYTISDYCVTTATDIWQQSTATITSVSGTSILTLDGTNSKASMYSKSEMELVSEDSISLLIKNAAGIVQSGLVLKSDSIEMFLGTQALPTAKISIEDAEINVANGIAAGNATNFVRVNKQGSGGVYIVAGQNASWMNVNQSQYALQGPQGSLSADGKTKLVGTMISDE